MERWVASDSFVYAAVRVEAFCSLLLLKWRPAAAANTNISKYFIFEPCKNFCTVSPPAGRVERVSPLILDMLNLGGGGPEKQVLKKWCCKLSDLYYLIPALPKTRNPSKTINIALAVTRETICPFCPMIVSKSWACCSKEKMDFFRRQGNGFQ